MCVIIFLGDNMDNGYLNEEMYEKGKNKIRVIICVVIIIGLAIGGGIIYLGINRSNPERINTLTTELSEAKQELVTLKQTLTEKNKPVTDEIKKLSREPFRGFTEDYYERQDKIAELEESIKEDTKTVEAIDYVFEHGCTFNHNVNLNKYCNIYNSLEKANNKTYSIPFYMFGGFIIIAMFMMTIPLTFMLKGREITSYMTEQGMPIAKESIEKMGPSVAKMAKDIKDKIK